ncbi:VRR-NUC domain-containing protein [Phenylobacterium sp. LjRoot164]|uniref:VRR-NUC domain-containing protein n=1 Tax=unclassified Phenylobacterium TaxID=2640670 RepID=UPI003ECFD227
MRRDEQVFHQQVARFINAAYPGLLWFHAPNGAGNRGVKLGAILKSMGVRAGVPDITIVLPTGHAAFIELKTATGSLSKEQREFRDQAKAAGAFWCMARSLDEVADQLHAWLNPLGWTSKARLAA